MATRIGKYDYYLSIAAEVAKRGTCLRRNYGAVIVKDDEIIATGYTGAPRGSLNCCDIGTCKRVELDIPSGQRYELCRSVHAEMNAIISASRSDMRGANLFLFGWEMKDGQFSSPIMLAEPCMLCKRVITNAGIMNVISYKNPDAKSDMERYSIQSPGLWVASELI